MFSVYLPEGEPRYSAKRRLIDADRDISLEARGGTGPASGEAFVLRHGNMCIPFHTRLVAGLVDAGTGKPFFTSEIISFGTSIFLKGDRNVPDHEFSSDGEARRWRRIAAEAVLIYGLGYNGLKFDPDYARVILDGEVLTRRDFGYTH